MLESLAAWVLNTYIGDYLENLNTNQLSIALLQGYAELENVPLKKTALRKFDVPVRVRSGVVGKLTLSIPLTHLKSEPWVVTVSDLYVVLEPNLDQYDMEFEAQYAQEKKRLQLEALEATLKKRLCETPSSSSHDASSSESQNSGWWAYGASIVSTIVENIQLVAANVHIRYEDDHVVPGRLLSCGVNIKRLSVQSVDSNWVPGFIVRREGENIRKLLELKDFSVYWDSGCDNLCKSPDNYRELLDIMKKDDNDSDSNARHRFLIAPLDFRIKMEKNRFKYPLKTVPPTPRFWFELEPSKLSLQGSRRQLAEMRLLMDEWRRYERAKPYRKWRPKAALSKSTIKQWWKFAIICHLDVIRQRAERRTWRYAYSRARHLNAYCKAYTKLLAGRLKELTKSDEILMKLIEREYSFEELQLFKETAFRHGLRTGVLTFGQHPSTSPASTSGRASPSASTLSSIPSSPRDDQKRNPAASGGFLSSWFGSWWAAPTEESASTSSTEISAAELIADDTALQEKLEKVEQELEGELRDIYNETVDQSAVIGSDLLFASINLCMKSLNVSFAEEHGVDSSLLTVHQCLKDASLDLGLKVSYMHDDNLDVALPMFEVSAKFGDGLSLFFDNKQYDALMQSLAGLRTDSAPEIIEPVAEQSNLSAAAVGSRRSSSEKPQQTEPSSGRPRKRQDRRDRVDFRFLADIDIPRLSVELRSDLNGDIVGQPVVTCRSEALTLSYRKEKPHICSLEMSMSSFMIIDLLEGSVKTPNLPFLLKASGKSEESLMECIPSSPRSFLSRSCPDIADACLGDDSPTLSVSLPTPSISSLFVSSSTRQLFDTTGIPSFSPSLHNSRRQHRTEMDERASGVRPSMSYTAPTSSPADDQESERGRKRHSGENLNPLVRVMVTLVDSVNEDFDKVYKKVGTLINLQVGDVELVINSETWVIVLGFFGLIGSPATTSKTTNVPVQDDTKKLQIDADIVSLRITFNKPNDKYQLGNVLISDLQSCILADPVGFSLNGQSSCLSLYDTTPNHSRLYPHRLRIAPFDKRLQFLFYKYNNDDPLLKREFDACLALHARDNVNYIHTQRYLSELIQFWQRFAELWQFYSRAKTFGVGSQKVTEDIGRGFRMKLRMDFGRPKLFLPISSIDEPVLVIEASTLTADNDFILSNILEERHSSSKAEPDCVLDILHLHLDHVKLCTGIRTCDDDAEVDERHQLVDFDGFGILINKVDLLNRTLPLDICVTRNLDTGLSRNVADLAIHTAINSVAVHLEDDVYATIRAILDYNLGEEIAQSTGSTASQTFSLPWATLEITCDLNNVLIDCFAPYEGNRRHLGRVDFERVRFSFEAFSDNTKQIDLICHAASLIDTRFEDVAANKRGNVFSTIWSSLIEDEIVEQNRLLGEIHYAIDNRCSTLTLVFSKARLLFIADWLQLAQAFLMTEKPCNKALNGKIKIKQSATEILTKTKVLQRSELAALSKSDFKLKTTLSHSEIVFLEKPSLRNSLSIIAKITASLYFENISNRVKFECRDSIVHLLACVYGSRAETETRLTDDFTCSAELSPAAKSGYLAKYVNLGLNETVIKTDEYILKIVLSNLLAKASYRDYLVCRAVLDAYINRWDGSSNDNSQFGNDGSVSSRSTSQPDTFVIEKIELKLECVRLCLLDDCQDTRFPLFKFSIADAAIEHRPAKSKVDHQDGCGTLAVEIAYFNRKVYGWEPLLEPWKVDNLSWSYNGASNALSFEILADDLLDFTLTKTFTHQMSNLTLRWPTVSSSLCTDFRSGFSKRLDILPYLLMNQTGAELTFHTGVSTRNDSSSRKIDPGKKITVANEETRQFTFETNSWEPVSHETSDPFASHYIVIQVDGWHEISPIPVDAVGTSFRLARLNDAKRSVLSETAPYTRVVAAVSIDRDGRKLITVRSALMFVNGLTDALQIRLESTRFVGDCTEFVLPPGSIRPAPLAYANSKIVARPAPAGDKFNYCKPISWNQVSKSEETRDFLRICETLNKRVYRMCVCVKAEAYPELLTRGSVISGHTISFAPPVIIQNLLPIDLSVNMADPSVSKTVAAAESLPMILADLSNVIELTFNTEYFCSRRAFIINPAVFQEQIFTLEMIDNLKRPLMLQATLSPLKGGGVKMSVSAPFWFVNKSGLPLIIKQEAAEEAAGQFEEHEQARSMLPVMFSFADNGAPLKCCLRLGKAWHPENSSVWSRSFVLEPGITFKELVSTARDKCPAQVYNIGVEVRPGQGLYKNTQVVLLTARYLIDNRSRYKLNVSQYYAAERKETQYTISPSCTLAWHWPRQDLDLFLCVRRDDLPHWSSPFRIDLHKSFHITFRDDQGTPQFLRLEIILQGAVYYVTFSDADSIPAPIRIENLTDAPILYNQKGFDSGHLRAVLRQHTKVNYSFDDAQFKSPIIQLTAQNGKSIDYDLSILGPGEPLLYENFIYIAFARTFDEFRRPCDDADLVLEAMPKGKVILNRKDPQKMQQLWRMSSDGHLMNAAEWSHSKSSSSSEESNIHVLGTLSTPIAAGNVMPLMLLRLDPNKQATQRWRFTDDGRLMCGLPDLYVQAERRQLKAGVSAVLSATQPGSQLVSGVPYEQAMIRHRQRPGSGRLAVTVRQDGPTRVLCITDMADQIRPPLLKRVDYEPIESPRAIENILEFSCSCTLKGGIGISMVNNELEELIYCRFTGLILNVKREKLRYSFRLKVLEIQADNQIWNAERWTLLYIQSKFDEKRDPTLLALDLVVLWTPQESYDSFETFIVSINKIALYIDEILLWKLTAFLVEADSERSLSVEAGSVAVDHGASYNSDQSRFDSRTSRVLYQQPIQPNLELERPDFKQARRCYFGQLNLSCRRLHLSVATAHALPVNLRRLKQMYSMPLVGFENASVEVAAFQQSYYFETMNFLLETLRKHFTQELRSQAVKILGTVDFLGNPVGLFRDLSDSLQELIISANVSGFVTGVMHGFSSSAAKFTSSLSDQVGRIAMDDEHRQLRQSMKQSQSQNAVGHLLSGFKGLGIGVVGGVKSVFTQPVDGMKRDGVEGLVTGVVKGMVGAVAKPIQGVLDLAAGVSNAAKEAVSGSDGPLKSRFPPNRLRLPRVTRSLRNTLPSYSKLLATAQRTLLTINDGNVREICLSMDTAQQQSQVLVLICTQNVYFVRHREHDDVHVLLKMSYEQLQGCTCVAEPLRGTGATRQQALWQRPILEFALKNMEPQGGRSRIKCDSKDKAIELCEKILYAKQQYEDLERSLAVPEHYAID